MINHGIWGAYLMFGNMYMYIDNIYIYRERCILLDLIPIISYHIISYHIISYHIISYHIIYIYIYIT